MKKSLFLLITLLLLIQTVKSQNNIQGKWYTFARKWLVEFTITKDSFINSRLNWDFSTRRLEVDDDEKKIISKIIAANGNYYICQPEFEDAAKRFIVNTFKVIRPGKEMLFVINATEEKFSDDSAIERYIKNDTSQKFGLTLYSEDEIHRLAKQPSIEKLTAADFNLFAKKILDARKALSNAYKDAASSNEIMFYSYFIFRNTFAQIGFSPLITNDQLEKMIKRFGDDPETSEMYNKLMNE